MTDLPIDAVLPDLLTALRESMRALLIAPPGAGKTTRVAPALLDEAWCEGQVLLLVPRRLAARAAAHHENLDGTGYPLGLKDDQIRRETRIITVCDYYDALSSDRPYHASMTRAESLAIIAADVGTAIDPDCFDALRSVV